FLDHIGGLGNAVGSQLRNVNQTVARAEEVHESAEVRGLDDRAFVDFADFRFGNDRMNPLLGGFDFLAVRRCDLHRAVIFDVDLGAGLFHDFADDLAARTDNITDLVGRDVHHFDARSEFAEFFTRGRKSLRHFAENVDATALGLFQSDLHDLFGDTVDLDVHLQRGDAVFRTGNLEVHVAEVIFITEDVGQNGEAFAFLDQAHGYTGNRTCKRNACIHESQRRAANGCHRGRAVRFRDLGNGADRVRELLSGRQHRMDCAPGKLAMADFATARRTHAAGFTNRVRREVVVQHERLLVGAGQGVDHLFVFAGAERGNNDSLRFTAGKQGRTVGARQKADFRYNRTNGLEIAAIDAAAGVENVPANDLGLQMLENGRELFRRHFGFFHAF